MLKKIVVIGPESTGKSTLCEQLAIHFKTHWVPEYARVYLETVGTQYSYDDLYTIAEGQLVGEDVIAENISAHTSSSLQYVFIDTDLQVIKVWSEFVFDKCDNRILTLIAERNYDLYLLCCTDLPWIKDPLREYPDLETRNKLFNYYKDAMINQNVPWIEISGNYEMRLAQAINAVNKFIKLNTA